MTKKIPSYLLFIMITCFCQIRVSAQLVHQIAFEVNNLQEPSKYNFTVLSKTKTTKSNSLNAFTIIADVGDSIMWMSKDSQKPVKIISVNYVSGPRIFSSNTITGNNKIKSTIIRGGDKDYVYELHYTIGSESKVYKAVASIKTKS